MYLFLIEQNQAEFIFSSSLLIQRVLVLPDPFIYKNSGLHNTGLAER